MWIGLTIYGLTIYGLIYGLLSMVSGLEVCNPQPGAPDQTHTSS